MSAATEGVGTSVTGAYIKGKPAEIHEAHHHVMPISTYLKVFGALLVFTVLTVLVSYADLGKAALPTAMFIAFVKAGLVIGYFMHLKFDTRFHAFVFFSTLIFVAIFFVMTFLDIKTRGLMNPSWDNKVLVTDSGALDKPELTDIKPIPPAELEELRKQHPDWNKER